MIDVDNLTHPNLEFQLHQNLVSSVVYEGQHPAT